MQNPWHSFDQKWSLQPLPDANCPIFLLSSVWRSGSTLVQRLICSSKEIMLWGEPYGDAGIVPSLVKTSKVLLRRDWPLRTHYPEYSLPEQHKAVYENPQNFWIANLYPLPSDVRASYRQQLDRFLQEPAERHGISRFGLKEVRFDGECAHFLKWIYPDARFVFLVRNPWDAWRSYKGADWYFLYPELRVTRVDAFAKIWLRNMKSYLSWANDPSAHFLRFEDIIRQGHFLKGMLEHCQLSKVDMNVFNVKIRGMQKPPAEPSTSEIKTIEKICGPVASQLGYRGLHKSDESSIFDQF